MKTRIAKWGNSLAVRVPHPFAEEVGLSEGSEVEMSLVDGALVLKPSNGHEWTLETLLAGITEENLHPETDTGPATGGEAW